MKKIRLLCIPPYEGMYNLMTNIAAQRSDVELIIHMGNLEEGLNAALKNQDNNIDAIISRGGTAEIIRKYCDLPSCDIAISVYDVLRTIRLAQGMSEAFAVVGFPDITNSANTVRDIMQYNFQVFTIHSQEECESCIRDLKAQKIKTIVGDMIAVTVAQRLGIHGLLIVSGLESIEAAINNAVNIHQYYAAIHRQADLLSQLILSQNDDTLIYTANGDICFSTTHDLSPAILSLLKKNVPLVITQGTLKMVRQHHSGLLSIQGKRLQADQEDYCAYMLSSTPINTVLEKHMIRCLSADDAFGGENPLEYYLGGSDAIANVRLTCERYAGMDRPILLSGAAGTGKDCFVHYMYSISPLRHSSLIEIDLKNLSEKAWEFLMDSDSSPFTDSHTSIYLKRMESLDSKRRQQLLTYLKNSRVSKSNRLYFSFTQNRGTPPQDELYLYLLEDLYCLPLQLPSLSQRREDIPGLVSLYINAVNIQYGSSIVGLTRGAMLLLQNYPWPRNVNQLFRIVRNLVVSAKTSYISEESVSELLEKEKQSVIVAQENSIDLEQPLNEIVHDIVQRVYLSEDMNQTRTAKRLGISRSTLWRMLK